MNTTKAIKMMCKMNTRTALTISIASMLLISGCDMEKVNTPNANAWSPRVEVIIIEDGTRCVTWKDASAGGISCDWQWKKFQSNNQPEGD